MTASVLMLVRARTDGPMPIPGVERRSDYRLVREALDAELLDLGSVERSRIGRLVQRAAGAYVALAVLGLLRALRGGVDVVLCDNENEALVLALLFKAVRRRIPLVTIAVAPTARKKAPFFRLARVQSHVDLWLPYVSVQASLLISRYHVPPDRVRLLPFHADSAFFDPSSVDSATAPRPTGRPYVLAVGRQDRDYPTLLEAAADLPVDVVIDVGSLYSHSPDTLTGRPLPPTVHLVSLGQLQLRAAYAFAEVVVVPTNESDIGAGSTTVLEGMAMARPVVTTRSEGSGDVLADRREVLRASTPRDTRGMFGPVFAASSPQALGPHGFYVPPGDAPALRAALRYLLDHPEEAAEFGRRGRALIVDGLSTDYFVRRVVAAVQGVRTGTATPPEMTAG